MAGTNLLALMLAAALNPLVVRLPEPAGNVPADCEVSDRPAAPRVRVADAQPPEEMAPLPAVRPASTRTTGSAVTELNRAVANNDRPAFDAALAEARAARVPVRVYEDVARLWDAQFEAPFFTQESEAYRIASSYPGYEEAMRPHVFTDARGRKFYPAAESRRFVAGMKPATSTRPPAQTARRAPASTPSSPAVTAPPSRGTTQSRPKVATQRRTTSGARGTASRAESARPAPAPTPTRSETRQPAASREPAAPSTPDPSAPPQSAATDPAPAASPVVDTSTTEAPPAAGSLDTAAPATADTAPTTTEAAPTTGATTTAAPAPKKEGRPIILPAILIVIGLGVLFLLFRTRT